MFLQADAGLHVITHLYFLELENRHALAVEHSENRLKAPHVFVCLPADEQEGSLNQSIRMRQMTDFVPIRSVDVAEILIKLALAHFRPLQAISRSHDFLQILNLASVSFIATAARCPACASVV